MLMPYDGEPCDVPNWHKATVHRDDWYAKERIERLIKV
jgi:hypothetical protein